MDMGKEEKLTETPNQRRRNVREDCGPSIKPQIADNR